VRSPVWQAEVLRLPLTQRRSLAAELREASDLATASKTTVIMDVDHGAVEHLMRRFEAAILIHGHTHRPGRYEAVLGERYVLADWRCAAFGVSAGALVITEDRIDLSDIHINQKLAKDF